MKNRIFELSENKKITGRRYIKWIIHEIYNDPNKWNKNGISWKEQYVLNNIDSLKGMPICVEFLDCDKSEPMGHGLSNTKDNKVLFEYSTTVGTTEGAYIDDIEVDGETIRALIGEGYIYEQRYPNFVDWIKTKLYDKEFPDTLVEICNKANGDNETIIYENNQGGEGRIPMIYDYTGVAIIGIEPSDDKAILIEMNSYNNKEEEKMSKELEEKVSGLTEQVGTLTNELNELRNYKKQNEDKLLVAELNQKLSEYSDSEKEIVKNKVEQFSKEPQQGKINEIINEINSAIAGQVIKARKNPTNVQHQKSDAIFGDVFESNSNGSVDNDITKLY